MGDGSCLLNSRANSLEGSTPSPSATKHVATSGLACWPTKPVATSGLACQPTSEAACGYG